MNSNVTITGKGFATRGAAAILGCILGGTYAFAAEPTDQVRTQTVKFQDLNITTPAGVAALYQRIHSAAGRVCSEDGVRGLDVAARVKTCAEEAEFRAVADLNLPGLTAYYQLKTGHPVGVLAAKHAS